MYLSNTSQMLPLCRCEKAGFFWLIKFNFDNFCLIYMYQFNIVNDTFICSTNLYTDKTKCVSKQQFYIINILINKVLLLLKMQMANKLPIVNNRNSFQLCVCVLT